MVSFLSLKTYIRSPWKWNSEISLPIITFLATGIGRTKHSDKFRINIEEPGLKKPLIYIKWAFCLNPFLSFHLNGRRILIVDIKI